VKNAKLLTTKIRLTYYLISVATLPCELDNGHVLQSAKCQLTTAIKPNRPGYLRASVRPINDSKKGRSIAENTMSISKNNARNDRYRP